MWDEIAFKTCTVLKSGTEKNAKKDFLGFLDIKWEF